MCSCAYVCVRGWREEPTDELSKDQKIIYVVLQNFVDSCMISEVWDKVM